MEKNQETAASTAAGAAIKKKRDEKSRKKDPRSWENVLKVIVNLDEAAKFAVIEEKYNELYNEVRRGKAAYQGLENQYGLLKKESDHSQSELTKHIVARARLENLCRELQKQNKQIKEENIGKIKEEEERRKEVSLKFAEKLSDINIMMDENKDKSEKLRDENLKMTAKLAEFYTRFQKREEDIAKMAKEMDLQRQCSQATLAKMELEIQAEKEIYLKEYAIMQAKLEKSEANCRVLLDTVKGLQDHIDVYKSQYEDFESTMSKSNKVFDSFKCEMGAMSKQMTALEKEAQNWKSKYHDSTNSLIELSKMKATQDLVIKMTDKKVEQLQKLCRQLQVDRTAFLKLLKSNGIEATSQTCVEEKTETKKPNVKATKKEQELEMLKTNLQAMQAELKRVKSEVPPNAADATNIIEGAVVPEPQDSIEPPGFRVEPVKHPKGYVIAQVMADIESATKIVDLPPNSSQDVLINNVNPPDTNDTLSGETKLAENTEEVPPNDVSQ